MREFGPKIELGDLGLDHAPLVRAGVVDISPPSLRDNTGLADRLARTAARAWGLAEVSVPPGLAPRLVEWHRRGVTGIWAACAVEERRGRVVAVEAGPGPGGCFGLAVDVGSTTLALALVDLEKPRIMDQLDLINPQVKYGPDILTRVHLADKAEWFERLCRELLDAVNQGLAELCRRNALEPGQVTAGVVAGNTAMTHFLLRLPVGTLIREPYVPVLNRPEGLTAGEIGLDLSPLAPVLVLPNKGAYFGGDLLAGLVVAGLARAEEPCLLVDVGTNAEVVLGQKDWLIGAAGAAGPALEGGVAAMGVAAGPGAVDWVRIDRRTGQVRWRTIDGGRPRGLCGSGLIDLFAELFLSGLIDFRGRLTLPRGHERRVETDEGPAFVVAPGQETESGRPLTLSEVELDLLIRSKAAMYTILSTVLASVGLEFGQVQRFYMAGTFGQFLDPRMAVAVGMVPDIPLERYVSLGNSSLKGAVLTLVSTGARAEVLEVWRRLTYLEMNVNQDLMNRFSAARFIPHTERSLFPSVGTIIK
ncbi:MAG: ASKHA domain-containing protein [Thermodesulfobacteriota bacterium]